MEIEWATIGEGKGVVERAGEIDLLGVLRERSAFPTLGVEVELTCIIVVSETFDESLEPSAHFLRCSVARHRGKVVREWDETFLHSAHPSGSQRPPVLGWHNVGAIPMRFVVDEAGVYDLAVTLDGVGPTTTLRHEFYLPAPNESRYA